MKKIFKILKEEHKNILKVIEILIKEFNNEKIDYKVIERCIKFIRNYADSLHHTKEEDILFKELSKKGILTHCNPVEQMLYEHDLGRKFVKGMIGGLKKKNDEKISENAMKYAELLKEHINKEDIILYPMAEEVLSDKVKKMMTKKFKEIDNERVEEIKEYLQFAKHKRGGKK